MAFDFFGGGKRGEDKRMIGEERDDLRMSDSNQSETEEKLKSLKAAIEGKESNKKFIEAFKKIKDPELNVDVWTLGLIYGIEEDLENKKVDLKITFTSPLCPFGQKIVGDILMKLEEIGFKKDRVNLEVVYDPAWVPTKELREILGV